ncbi:retrovirus-related pol polyprotein from transposon TNT 1-94 [Tanacetum coccineum]
MDQDSTHMVATSKFPMLKPDEKLLQEDVSQKLLRSLSPEWSTHAVVWRNKADLDTKSMDDLYNNLKVYKLEVKRMSSSSSSTHDMAFVSSSNNNTSSTNEAVNTTHDPKWSATTATRGDILLGSAKLYEIKTTRTIKAQEGAEEGPNYALMAFSSSSPDLEVSNDSICSKSCLETVELIKSQNDQLLNDLKKFELMVLDEFVNKPVVENCKAMSSEEDPKVVRKYDDAPSIKELASDDEEEDNLVPRAVLMKSGLVSVNTARQVNAAHSKTTVNAARPMSYLSKTAHSTVKSLIHKNTTFKYSNINQRVNTIRDKKFNTASPKAVVNVVKGNNFNVVKASACWVWKPKHKVLDHVSKHNSASITLKKFNYIDVQGRSKSDQGVIDSGCSRHMTENMSYLIDYEEIDGGYVSFGGNPKGGKITGKEVYLPNFLKMIKPVLLVKRESSTEPFVHSLMVLQVQKQVIMQVKLERRQNLSRITFCYHYGLLIHHVGGKTSIELPFDPNMPALEDYSIFDFSRDDEDDGIVVDMNNLDTTIQVIPNPTTRIHKDHPLDQVIGDLQSATQTRKMSKNLEEHGFVKITQKGNSCIEGSKLDRGYAGRASTIQDIRILDFRYIQEEGMDYDEVFAPVSRIKAIRLFLAYASFKDFVVYQMDVKSAFLYGKIKEEVYVCQPPGFEDLDFPDRMSSMGELTFFLGLQVKQKKDGIFISQDIYVAEILKKFRSMISSLMYLTSSRPDIMFAVCACDRYQVNPKVSHLHAVKRIFSPKTTSWNEFSSTMAFAIICLAINQKFSFSKLTFKSMIRNLDSKQANIFMYPRRIGKGFSGRVTPLFQTMVVQNQSQIGKGLVIPTDPHHTPTFSQPSTQPQKTQKPRKPKRKDTQVPQLSDLIGSVADEAIHKELGDSLVRTATTASSLEVKKDSGNIDKT